MSKSLCAAVASALLVLVLSACGSGSSRDTGAPQQGVTEVLEEQAAEADGEAAAQEGQTDFAGDAKDAYADADVEVDLTAMNADMVYATVYDMMENPADYRGKVVRMTGPYYHNYLEETDTDYYFVIIQDATACCSQGLEFVWGDGSHVYPDEYPADSTEVVVTGTFDTYEENGDLYAHLVDASLRAA